MSLPFFQIFSGSGPSNTSNKNSYKKTYVSSDDAIEYSQLDESNLYKQSLNSHDNDNGYNVVDYNKNNTESFNCNRKNDENVGTYNPREILNSSKSKKQSK